MNTANKHDTFLNSSAGDFPHNVPTRRTSRTSGRGRQRERGEPSGRQGDHTLTDMRTEAANFQTLKQALDVLREGEMDVVGFLDVLCWGYRFAIADLTTKSARTNLMHSDQLAVVVSHWFCPPQTSQGGPRAGGARHVLLPLVINTVKDIINNEIDVVVEELKEDSADITEQSVLGAVIDEVQERVLVIAPVFYDLVMKAAWREKQEERNTLKDPTKASVMCFMHLYHKSSPQ
ncbi:hypothetical protein BJ322DRAFT_1021189 [Thelephora terrestris]|uniref:Uncharacterized protein n=1 Tax=Thelephora terrestris TaxID=56493 RepID=A0A9P6L666_9AGAM|nr:hypothetical protein BJ322DRAFT_1021189 [Thelephora terrestris]